MGVGRLHFSHQATDPGTLHQLCCLWDWPLAGRVGAQDKRMSSTLTRCNAVAGSLLRTQARMAQVRSELDKH